MQLVRATAWERYGETGLARMYASLQLQFHRCSHSDFYQGGMSKPFPQTPQAPPGADGAPSAPATRGLVLGREVALRVVRVIVWGRSPNLVKIEAKDQPESSHDDSTKDTGEVLENSE